jgi:hypothetical protein
LAYQIQLCIATQKMGSFLSGTIYKIQGPAFDMEPFALIPKKHEKKNCHAIFNPSKAPGYTGTGGTSYVEDVSLFCVFRVFRCQ